MSDPEQIQKTFNEILRKKAQREMQGRSAASKLAELSRRLSKSRPERLGADSGGAATSPPRQTNKPHD